MRRLAFIAAALALHAAASFAQTSIAEVRVDARRDAPGADLASLKRIFQSASAPEANGGLEPAWPVASALGMKALRSINDAEECTLDVARKIDWCDRLRNNLHWAQRYRLVPHVVVGQRQPAFIKTPGAKWNADDWARYEDFAKRLIRYVAMFDARGFREVIIEVGNEADITGNAAELWTLENPNVAQGADARYEHYMRIFRAWSKAVSDVAREFPDKRILIAGPAMGGQGAFLNGGVMYHERFTQAVAREKLRLDILSLHFYGDILRGWPNTQRTDLASLISRMHAALRANRLRDTRVFITEWAASEDVASPWNAGHEGASWAVAFLAIAADAGASGGSLWATRDVHGADRDGTIGIGSYTHVHDGRDYPKAYANAFAMLEMLSGTRRVAAATEPALRAVAASDERSAGVVLTNYGLNFWTHKDESVPRKVRVVFTGLPFSGPAIAERYLVDESHGNVARWRASKDAWPANAGALEKIEEIGVDVVGGAATIPEREVGPSATVLWRLRPRP